MKLKHIQISRLYDYYQINTDIDPKLNIFVGNNGSYKTTMLRTIYDGISNEPTMPNFKFQSFKLDFDNDAHVEYFKSYQAFKSNNIFDNNTSSIPAENLIEILNAKALAGNEIADVKETVAKVKADSVFTYDVKGDNKSKDSSYLTYILESRLTDYGAYLADLSESIAVGLQAGDANSFKEVFATREKFKEIINNAFSETGKLISNVSKMLFVKKDDDKETEINWRDLSSGEKQLIIILLTVLLQRGEESILIMDEPEISMHIIWQSQLLDWIYQLNPNVQVIMSTHSPSIFGQGWANKIIYMEDILKKE